MKHLRLSIISLEWQININNQLKASAISILGYASRKCASLVSEATVQLSENGARARVPGDPGYRILRGIIMRSAGQKLLEQYGLKMETTTRCDNRKLFPLLHKTTITRETISEIVRDNNGMPVKNIKDHKMEGIF